MADRRLGVAAEGVEAGAAAACRAHHGRFHGEGPFLERRRALAAFAGSFYRDRLKVDATPGERRAWADLADPDRLAVEMAHDGQLPHLGIVRMVLKAEEVARLDGPGVALYLIGSHYTPEMRPDNIRYGMPLKGLAPDAVKHPPKLRIGKANAHTPFRWLPPPAGADLETLLAQLEDFVDNNVAYARESLAIAPDDAKAAILERLRAQFAALRRAAAEVGSLGDWLIRVQRDLFRAMVADRADRIVFLPMAEVADLFRPDLESLARDRIELFWIHCPSCKRRQRLAGTPEGPFAFRCSVCRHEEALAPPEAWRWIMPDIVAYEAGLFRLDIDGWVVGSHAAYHPQIEALYAERYRAETPPTFFLTSVPTFRGIGEPPEGHRRTRLLRALLEVSPEALAQALDAPWDENPRIVSEFLKP